MAIATVQRPDPVRQEPKADPLDKILKGLQIASNLYGIRTAYEQSLLNEQKLASQTEVTKQEKNQSEMSQRSMNLINAGVHFQSFYQHNYPGYHYAQQFIFKSPERDDLNSFPHFTPGVNRNQGYIIMLLQG